MNPPQVVHPRDVLQVLYIRHQCIRSTGTKKQNLFDFTYVCPKRYDQKVT